MGYGIGRTFFPEDSTTKVCLLGYLSAAGLEPTAFESAGSTAKSG
jgi:hypothetical protein